MFSMANILTGIRILCSAAMLFFPALTPAFYTLFVAAGITDMIDGPVARKTNTVSELGSQLDTAADLVLVAVCLVKLIPVLDMPIWIYIWIAVIALIKAVNFLSGYLMQNRLVALHTTANKVTGLLLFLFPLTLSLLDPLYSGVVICLAATFAAVQEGHLIRTKAGSREKSAE